MLSKMCPKVSPKSLKISTCFMFFLPCRSPGSLKKKRQNLSAKKSENYPKTEPNGVSKATLFSIKWPQGAQGPRDPPPGGPWTSQIMIFYDFGPQNDPRNYWNLGSVRKQLITVKHQKKIACAPPCISYFLGGVPVGRVPAFCPLKKKPDSKRG